MTRIWYAAVTVLMAMAALLVGPAASPAYACSCVERTDAEAAAAADLVVEAVVTQVRHPLLWFSDDPVRVQLLVEQVEKGDAGEQLTLRTRADEDSCGFGFQEGHRYRVHASEGWTNLCSGNQHLGAAELSTGGGRPTAAVATSVAVLSAAGVAGAFLLVRRRRSGSG